MFSNSIETPDGYIVANFDGTAKQLNEKIDEGDPINNPNQARRVTIEGTAQGKNVGSAFTVLDDCEIRFEN